MSDIIFRWLHEILGQSFERLEEDFANGYLIAAILYKYNQQQNLDQFVDKHTANSMINNWCKLEPTFRNLGLKLRSMTAHAVMTCKPGAALGVLYKLKVVLEKVTGSV